MYNRFKPTFSLWFAALSCLVLTHASEAQKPRAGSGGKDPARPQRTMVTDGSPVHDVGNLHVHIPNWGIFGSMPSSARPFQAAPSAEWPAGSGVEHLYVAGLWVGAVKNGVPAVSTAAYAEEFLPTDDPRDVVYYSAEGAPGGGRLPYWDADDDGDGRVDEEWLDGRDDDGDGRVDEDYAAISDQMLSSWYTDDQPAAVQIYPQHNPLHLLVRQRSYQWRERDIDNFVALDYTVFNTGQDTLEDVYIGLFVDADVGHRDTDNYWEDDAAGFVSDSRMCGIWGATSVDFAYVYDVDGDNGQAPGYAGVVLLDHTTDPTGATAPAEARFVTYQTFSGGWGDPTNDFERYQVMSSEAIGRNQTVPRDYSYVVACGPFPLMAPGEKLEFRVAYFVGDGSRGWARVENGAHVAKLTYQGRWFDLDADASTGVGGRETPISGPATDVVVDACQSPPVVVPSVPPGEVVWVNADCAEENEIVLRCGYAPEDTAYYRTGIGGKESVIHWLVPGEPSDDFFVTGFDVDARPAAAVLSWGISDGEGVSGFLIVRTDRSGGRLVLPALYTPFPPDTRTFTDAGVRAGETYHYTLVVVMDDGSARESRGMTASIPVVVTELHQNRPNPFNPGTTIPFTLAEMEAVTLSIYTPEGKLVTTLVDEVLPADYYDIPWDGTDARGSAVSSGIYLYRLRAGGLFQSRKMVYLK